MRRARIVQLIPDLLGVGGAEQMMVSLAVGLDKERYDVKVLSFFDPVGTGVEQRLADAGVELVSLGKEIGFDPIIFPRVAAALRRLAPDIVHSHRPVFPYALPSIVGKLRGRVIHTVHNVAEKEVEDRLRRAFHLMALREKVSAVAICDFVADSIVRVYGVQPRATIPNGIPVKSFALSREAAVRWRAANGVPQDAFVFVCVARLAPQKNQGALLQAFAALHDRPDALLLLVGDGPTRGEIEERTRALGLSDRVRMMGTRSDIPEILAAADVFVLPSKYEGNPLSVMEAMASGKPVIATAVGGVPELVRSGETGLLVPPCDVGALAAAMRQLLTNREMRERFAARASEIAAQRFDVAQMIAAYDRLYQEVLAECVAPRRSGARGQAARPATKTRRVERKSRIVQVIPNLAVGGAEQMMLSLATGLDRDRYDVKVLSFFDPTGTAIERGLAASGIEVVTLGKVLGFDPRMFQRIATALKQLRPDIVHTHRPVFPYALPSIVGKLHGRVVHTVHSVADKEVEDRLRRFSHWLAFRAGVLPVAICDFVANSIASVHGVAPRATIPNGIPVQQFALPSSVRATWRQANGVSPGSVVFVCVARLAPVKNQGALLQAFAALGNEPNALLILCGDGPLRSECEQLVVDLGIEDRVRLLGTRTDVAEILAASDVFVLPSLYEGNPLSVMEAMAAGKPVVATSVGGVPEFVHPGENGLLVPPSDIAALTRALKRLLDDVALRETMGAVNREVARNYDVSRMVDAYDRLYQEVLDERRRPAHRRRATAVVK